MDNRFTDNDDIHQDSFDVEPVVEDTVTLLICDYAMNYAKNYFIENYKIRDGVAAADQGREYPKQMEFEFVRDPDTAKDVARRMISRLNYAPMHALFDSSLRIAERDLTDIVRLDHFIHPQTDKTEIAGVDLDLDNLAVAVDAPYEQTPYLLAVNGGILACANGNRLTRAGVYSPTYNIMAASGAILACANGNRLRLAKENL